MPYQIRDLVFRLELRGEHQIALKLEKNEDPGQNMGKEVLLANCGGRTDPPPLVANVIEEEAIEKLMETLREKLGG